MLFRAYTAIETQIYAGDSGLLVGQDPLEHYTGYIPDGQDTDFYQSIVDDMRTRAMLRVDQLRKSVTRRHLSALAACVPVYAQDHRAYPPLTRLPAANFDQVKQWPVIALAAGGAIDLRPEFTAHGKSGIRGASQARGRPGHGGGDASGLVARPDRGAPGERVYAPRVRCDRLGRARCTARPSRRLHRAVLRLSLRCEAWTEELLPGLRRAAVQATEDARERAQAQLLKRGAALQQLAIRG